MDGMMDLKSLVFTICFRNGNTIPLYLSMAMARRLRIDTAVETSCKKERPLQRANPKNRQQAIAAEREVFLLSVAEQPAVLSEYLKLPY